MLGLEVNVFPVSVFVILVVFDFQFDFLFCDFIPSQKFVVMFRLFFIRPVLFFMSPLINDYMR